jgi:hypothetical protein
MIVRKVNSKKFFQFLIFFFLIYFLKVENCLAATCVDMTCAPNYVCKETTDPITNVTTGSCVKADGVDIGTEFKIKPTTGIRWATGYSDLGTFISSSIIPNVMMIANVILFILILASGFTIVTSAGNADKQKQASQTLTFSILGFIIIFAAYWIMQALGYITGGSMDFLFNLNS